MNNGHRIVAKVVLKHALTVGFVAAAVTVLVDLTKLYVLEA